MVPGQPLAERSGGRLGAYLETDKPPVLERRLITYACPEYCIADI